MTKYPPPKSTYSIFPGVHIFPQTFAVGSWSVFQTFLYSSYADTELIKINKLTVGRDPGTAGNWRFRILDSTDSTARLSAVFTGLSVDVSIAGGFSALTTALAANTRTEVYPGLFVTTNATKVTTLELNKYDVIADSTVEFFQDTASANFWIDTSVEVVRTTGV